MRNAPIFIIDKDAAKLRGMLAARKGDRNGLDEEHLLDLSGELERASVVHADAIPSGVVLLNSRVQLTDRLTGKRHTMTLVFPSEADPGAGRVSVLAPLGCALMGSRVGEIVEWTMPGGLRRLQIDKVSSPEASETPDGCELNTPQTRDCTLQEARS